MKSSIRGQIKTSWRTPVQGYTIFEVMIVLAVTSVLFLSVVVMFSGRQARTQFSQSMFDLQSTIQGYANDVATGSFPASSSYSCAAKTFAAPYYTRPALTATANAQSTNQACLYVGKAVQAIAADDSLYIYNVLGLRTIFSPAGADSGVPAESLADANPEPALDTGGAHYYLTDTYKMLPGVKIVSAKYYADDGTSKNAELLELYTAFQSTSANGQAMAAYTIPGLSSISAPPAGGTVDAGLRKCIELQSPCDSYIPVGGQGWRLCLQDSGTTRKAELTVKGTATGITTSLNMAGCTA